MIFGSVEALCSICSSMGFAPASSARSTPEPNSSAAAMFVRSFSRSPKPCVSRGKPLHLLPPAPRPLHRELRGGRVVRGLVVSLVRLFHHGKAIGVHRRADATRHLRGVDVAPEVEVDKGAIGRSHIVLMRRLGGGRGIHDILHGRVLVRGGRAPDARHDGNADALERFLHLFHPLTPFDRDAFRPR